MKKIILPQEVRGKELFDFLVTHKSELITQKKSVIKYCDAVTAPLHFVNPKGELIEQKANQPLEAPDLETLPVKVVGNAMYWCDTQMDVLTTDSAKRTIQQRKHMIVHLKDHNYELEAQIGDVTDVYLEDVALRKLGLNKSGSTQCVIMESDVQKSYSPRIFQAYKDGKINQHSIGINYVQIELAINDPEWEKEMDFWNKYYDKIINKEVPDEMGYFWVVNEFKLLEVSAVLFGANELTPTLQIGKGHLPEPAQDEAPLDNSIEDDKKFDVDVAILTTKFF